MASVETHSPPPAPVLDDALRAELPSFELFFKTFGFRRMQGRIWGLLVLSERPLSSKEVSTELEISQGATSTALNELAEWGAISSCFDPARRCHLHAPVGNAMSIVATVFRRREQVVFEQFKQTSGRALEYIRERYGDRDPRVLTLRSIITTCELAEALMQLVFSAVTNALGDSESLLSKALNAALKVGMGTPARLLFRRDGTPRSDECPPAEEAEDGLAPPELAAPREAEHGCG